jgi:hypothetical protein
LSRRKAVSFANLKTFVPGLPFGRDFFLRRHRFYPCPSLGRSYTWWNWPVFQEHCEHVLASSRVSQQAAVRKRQSWLLSAKAAAVADIVDPLLMTRSGQGLAVNVATQ